MLEGVKEATCVLCEQSLLCEELCRGRVSGGRDCKHEGTHSAESSGEPCKSSK